MGWVPALGTECHVSTGHLVCATVSPGTSPPRGHPERPTQGESSSTTPGGGGLSWIQPRAALNLSVPSLPCPRPGGQPLGGADPAAWAGAGWARAGPPSPTPQPTQ